MPYSAGERQAHLLQLYDSHPFECHLSTLYHLDQDACCNSQPPRWAGTLQDHTQGHSKSQEKLSILNGIAHLLAKSADPEKSRVAVSAFRSGAETTRGCPDTTVLYCKDTPYSPELKKYVFRVLKMLKVAQRMPLSRWGDNGRYRLGFFILVLEVIPWCWERISVLAGGLKVALEALKTGYPPPWGYLDEFFLGYWKAAKLEGKKKGKDLTKLVVKIEKMLSKVLELSPPPDNGRKHRDAKKQKEYFRINRRPIYMLLKYCDDLNDLVKSNIESDYIERPHVEQKKLWDVMARVTPLATYYATAVRLGYFATRQTGRQYVDFSKLRIVEVSPVPRPHRVCIPSDPTWVINELHARQPQAGHPGDSYTEDEVKCTVNNLYAQIAIPRRSQWNPQPKAKGVESVICRQHPEVAIAHAMLNFYSLVGRPNSGIWIFIGTSNDSCVMCRRYLDLLEQECSPPLPEYPLKPAPQKRPVYFVLSKYSQRPLGWKMPEGASEEIVERINLGLKQDLDKIVLRLRNDWGYRKRKPKPAAVSLEGGDEDVVACMRRKTQEARIRMERLGFKSMSRPSGVGRFRIWGIEDLLEAGEEGEEAGGVGEAGKVDERREIRKADEEEIGETCEEEDIAIGKREPEVREEESVAAGVGRGGE